MGPALTQDESVLHTKATTSAQTHSLQWRSPTTYYTFSTKETAGVTSVEPHLQ